MTTSVDSNVFVALWNPDHSLNGTAEAGLQAAMQDGNLVISGPVYSELLAAPGRDEGGIEHFILETGIIVDWLIEERIWREAGRAYQRYATARKKQHQPAPRQILADFVIGAHALVRKHRLLTLDQKIYRTAFPSLTVIGL